MNIKSTFIRKRGKNYNVVIEYINKEGDLKQKSEAKYKNKKDAEKHLIDLKSSINNNKFIISKDITFVDRFKMYLYDDTKDFSPLTIKNEEYVLKSIIQPFFNDILLKDVTPYILQTFINNIYAKYAKSTSKRNVTSVKAVLNEAYRLKEINENPCDFVKSPVAKDSKTQIKEPFSKEECKYVIENLEGKYFEIPFLLMLTMGLRAGEVCGLKWEDIDFNKNTISINRVLITVKSQKIFKEPKTDGSIRTLSAPSELIEKLKKLKLKHSEYKLAGLLESRFEDLVCFTTVLTPWSSGRLNEVFRDFCKKYDIRQIRLHDLRHTHATMLVLSGTDFKTISARLGHKDIKITLNRYSHVLEEMDQQASDNISNILFK